MTIHAVLDTKDHRIKIDQKLTYYNTSSATLDTIYFTDWANSFSDKTSPLAKQFAYHFKTNFHFEKNENRGRSLIYSITDKDGQPLQWHRGKEVDVFYVLPAQPLQPQESYVINLTYEVKIPDSKFTRFGYTKSGNYNLKYWFIAPAVFENNWQTFSNKNLDDFYMPPSDITLWFYVPESYNFISDLDVIDTAKTGTQNQIVLTGKDRTSVSVYIQKEERFEAVITDQLEVQTSINDKGLIAPLKAICIDRIIQFLDEELGEYPFQKIVVSEEEYRQNPAYGLNQLPNFIRPFPDGFQYDIELLKTITGNYLKNTLLVNPRDEHWFRDALQIYLMMKYTDKYYPDMKIFGNLSNVFGLKWFHASSLEFNDQYEMLYLNSALLNLDQPMSTPKDSLIKYNAEIAAAYKGGVGLRYLDNYLENNVVNQSIKEFYEQYQLSPVTVRSFEEIVKSKTEKDVDWFFDDYINTNKKIDYRIKKIVKKGDSLWVTIKNNRKHTMPFTLYGMNKKEVISKQWVEGFEQEKIIAVKAENIDRVAIDYSQEIPEYNKRNNYRKVSGLFKKPIQFRLLQDIEDPEYFQLFFIPVFEYNLYDGLSIGTKLYNKTFLPRNFTYKIEPQYGLNSNTLLGGASAIYSHPFENKNWYNFRIGFSGKYFSYDTDLFYRRVTAFSTLSFREKDLRSNKRRFINLRNVYVDKDFDEFNIQSDDPNYNVINLQYVFANANLLEYFRYEFDYEAASQFQKISATAEYRKLFVSNRQINLRLFAGAFLKNNTNPSSDYFSFALDRPTDYMFDYNYYGRSESSGLFSQQIIIAEGGFKSKMETPYANRWITTLNAGTNIWRWIHVYGDVGAVNNKYLGTQVFYDSGIRVSLVDDFFEFYFPLYSSNGWEPGLDRYDQRIRFIVTLQPETLIRLFTRRWY